MKNNKNLDFITDIKDIDEKQVVLNASLYRYWTEINTKEDYAIVLKYLDRLIKIDPVVDTKEYDILEHLSNLVQAYEKNF